MLPLPLLLLPLALSPRTVPGPAPGGGEPPPHGVGGEDLADVLERLEYAPEDPELLLAAARACLEAGDPDRARWYAGLGLRSGVEQRGVREGLEGLLEEVPLPEVGADELLDELGKELFSLAQTFQRRRYHANAVDVLVRCAGTRFEREADKKLEKLYSNDKAVEQIVASGLPVPARRSSMDPEELAAEDAEHADWEDHYEFESKLYTVKTNVGYELGSEILLALEQMNGHLREVNQYKTRGETMRRAVVHVYASQEEFMQRESKYDVGPTTGGFLVPIENRIATFDPRPSGRSLADLWETLFHEGSHQFTRAMMPNQVPAWFNEGTACYFEGARLLPSGAVRTNLVPEGRLKHLVASLDRGNPTLEMVLSYFQPGSYPGSYYSWGWGLVYFIQNYEDERCERIWRPIYADYVETYSGGGQHDVLGRWVEHFVEEAEVPGIETFEDWEALWKQWIRDLAAIEFGGPEQADVLIARGRRQREFGKHAAAVESYEWALRKRQDDPVALYEMAASLVELEREDEAVHGLRRVLSLVRARPDREEPLPGGGERTWARLGEEAFALLEKIDRNVAAGVRAVGDGFAGGMLEAADVLVEAGFPLAALDLLRDAEAVLGGDGRLERRRDEIRDSSGRSTERWRRLVVDAELTRWEARTGLRASPPDALDLDTATTVAIPYEGQLPPSYRYEATFEIVDRRENSAFGLCFGVNNQTGMRTFVIVPAARAAGVFEFGAGGAEETHDLGAVADANARTVELALEVEGDTVRFFVGGKLQGSPVRFSPDEVRGGVGVVGQNLACSIRDLRVRH